jgi:hypothetical protein
MDTQIGKNWQSNNKEWNNFRNTFFVVLFRFVWLVGGIEPKKAVDP